MINILTTDSDCSLRCASGSLRRTFRMFAFLVLTVSSCSVAISQETRSTGNAAISRGVNGLIETGLERCAIRLNEIVKSELNNDDSYGFITQPSATPNKNGSTLITAEDFSDGSVVRTFHVVPDAGGGCSILAHLLFISSESCAKLRDVSFSEWKLYLDLGASTAYQQKVNPSSNSSVVLTRVDKGGCAASKVFTLNYLED